MAFAIHFQARHKHSHHTRSAKPYAYQEDFYGARNVNDDGIINKQNVSIRSVRVLSFTCVYYAKCEYECTYDYVLRLANKINIARNKTRMFVWVIWKWVCSTAAVWSLCAPNWALCFIDTIFLLSLLLLSLPLFRFFFWLLHMKCQRTGTGCAEAPRSHTHTLVTVSFHSQSVNYYLLESHTSTLCVHTRAARMRYTGRKRDRGGR